MYCMPLYGERKSWEENESVVISTALPGTLCLLFHSCLATVSVDIEYQRVPRRWAREQIKSNRFLQVPTLAIKWEPQKQLEVGKCPVFSIKTQSDIEFPLFCPYHCMVYLHLNHRRSQLSSCRVFLRYPIPYVCSFECNNSQMYGKKAKTKMIVLRDGSRPFYLSFYFIFFFVCLFLMSLLIWQLLCP